MNNKNDSITNPLGTAKGIFCFKKVALLLFSLSFTQAVFSQAKMEILDSKKNFGIVKRGESVKNEYEITNAGNQPLIISHAEVACSCTTVEYPKQPLLPGQKEKVLVIFNTTSVYGRQDRVVLLKTNDPRGDFKLRFKGIVQNTK